MTDFKEMAERIEKLLRFDGVELSDLQLEDIDELEREAAYLSSRARSFFPDWKKIDQSDSAANVIELLRVLGEDSGLSRLLRKLDVPKHACEKLARRLRDLADGRRNLIPLEQVVAMMPRDTRPELIQFWDHPADPHVLLRASAMPEFAFALYSLDTHGTRDRLRLKIPRQKVRKFTVVCACCCSNRRTGEPPEDEDARKKWEAECEERYAEALAAACRQHGIHTVFMRHGDRWTHDEKKPAPLRSISVASTGRHRQIMCAYYDESVVDKALSCLEWTDLAECDRD